ncbi:uncharacterized protein [Anabrus simplex]|uniref:uncharacterized protein isoform X1 n=1 Tax=Anabrus simplex TaxID=316456 RepID=UPI0035A27564
MEQPVYIKCEPGCVSGTGKLNNADRDMKLPTDEQMDMKTEPEDVFYEPFIKGELGIQYHTLSARSEMRPAISGQNKSARQCKVCGKYLSSNTSLKEHLLVHSGHKPRVMQRMWKVILTSFSIVCTQTSTLWAERSHLSNMWPSF